MLPTDVNFSFQGLTPLMLAVSMGDLETVKSLVTRGANVDAKYPQNGCSPLMIALLTKKRAIAEYLLSQGADIDMTDNNGQTALILAYSKGDSENVSYILTKGANAEIKAGKYTLLAHAVLNGQEDMCETLLSNGAMVNAKHEYDFSPLLYSACESPVNISELLLDHGAEIEDRNHEGNTALTFAALNGKDNTVAMLLRRGADIESRDNAGYTPIIPAILRGHLSTIELLLSFGADVNAKTEKGHTALMIATGAAKQKKAIVELLLCRGADINAADINGRTALKFAEREKDQDIIDLLKAAHQKTTVSIADLSIFPAASRDTENDSGPVAKTNQPG